MKESIPYLVSIGMLVLQYGFYKHSIIAACSKSYNIGYRNGCNDTKCELNNGNMQE